MKAIANHEVSKAKRILVAVEDITTAHTIAFWLTQAGHHVIGIAKTVQEATAYSYRLPDAALLDMVLSGKLIWKVAERLAERRVPLLLLTGADEAIIKPARWQRVPLISKPITFGTLIARTDRLLRGDLDP